MVDTKNKLQPESVDPNRLSRRDFLKIAGAAVVGTVLTACTPLTTPPPETTPIPPLPTSSESSMDFNKISYCGIHCREACPEWAYPQTCDGCKSPVGNEKCAPYCCGCPVRKCAQEKGVLTCAHCDGFPMCDKDTWKTYPGLKGRVEQLRTELQLQP